MCDPRVEAVGYPEFWQQVHDRFPAVFKAIHDLHPLQRAIFLKPVSEPLHKVIRHLAKMTVNSLGALTTLVLNGYGNDAMKIARGMFEAAVNVCYLQKHPGELDDFFDYYWVRKYRLAKSIERTDPATHAAHVTDVAKNMAEFNKVKHRYEDKKGKLRGSWSIKSIAKRAADVGMGDHYETFYSWASSMHHGDISGMADQAEGNDVVVAPSFEWINIALITGHMAVLRCIGAYNEVASLGMESNIQKAMDDFLAAWKK